MTKLEYGQNVADLQGFRLDRQRLLKQAEQLSSKYAGAEPYPHIIIDDFLPSELLDAVIDEYPDPDEPFWMKMYHNNSRKLALNAIQFMGPVTVNLLRRAATNTLPTARSPSV